MKKNYARRYAVEFNSLRRLFQLIWIYFLAIPILCFFYRYEIQGRENIPRDRKFIIAGNHISYFDPFLVSIALQKPIAYMAKKELFEHNLFVTLMMDFLGAFAVNREKLEASTIKTVKEVLKSKWYLGIFPEGGIKRHKTIEKVNKGFAVIAKAANWDVLPVSIAGCEEYNWVPFRGKIIVKIGKPISFELSQDELVERWGEEVAQMSGYKHIKTASENTEAQDQKDFANA